VPAPAGAECAPKGPRRGAALRCPDPGERASELPGLGCCKNHPYSSNPEKEYGAFCSKPETVQNLQGLATRKKQNQFLSRASWVFSYIYAAFCFAFVSLGESWFAGAFCAAFPIGRLPSEKSEIYEKNLLLKG